MKYRKHVSTIQCTVKVPLYIGVEVLDMYMSMLSVLVDVSPKLCTLNSMGGVMFSEERSRYRNAQKRGVGDGWGQVLGFWFTFVVKTVLPHFQWRFGAPYLFDLLPSCCVLNDVAGFLFFRPLSSSSSSLLLLLLLLLCYRRSSSPAFFIIISFLRLFELSFIKWLIYSPTHNSPFMRFFLLRLRPSYLACRSTLFQGTPSFKPAVQ